MALIQSTAIPSGATGYEIEQSLKHDYTRQSYLTWTPASSGNRKTWTLSLWAKRAKVTGQGASSNQPSYLFGAHSGTSWYHSPLQWRAEGYIEYTDYQGVVGANSNGGGVRTTAAFRDPSAWYHVMLVYDTPQSTKENRLKIYVNGVQQALGIADGSSTNWGDSGYPLQNEDGTPNTAGKLHYLGASRDDNPGDGYLAEVNFIDGQALTPADFGETGDYGEWKPIEYSGTYGTNGFYLNFAGGGVMSATGGNSTATDGDYKAASFTSNGTFTPSANGYVEYLVIAGGGGGGQSHGAGGGGAGGYRTGYLPVTGGTGYSITVGAGGGNNGNGANSVFSTITSIGGGAGAYGTNENETGGTDGGSGGGGGAQTLDLSAGAGTTGQGNNGAAAINGSYWQGGGGGGAGAAGASGVGSTGGIGGAGLASSITGSSVTRAGGGGGGHHGGLGGSNGTGGSGGGGTAGDGTTSGSGTGRAGTANTGSGGGGSSGANLGGAGGSGIVIIRYKFQ